MNVKKITLKERGFKGMKVRYTILDQKDGSTWVTPADQNPSYPIPLVMEKLLRELRGHLLNICDVCQNPHTEDEFTYAVNDTEIVSVERDGDGFEISGLKKAGDKHLKYTTYWVEEGDYDAYKDVMDIIKDIMNETKEYLAGNRQITTEELGQRLIQNLIRKGKKGESELNEFQNMSDEDKKAYCTKYLEDTGAIVISHEDIELPDETQVIQLNKTA